MRSTYYLILSTIAAVVVADNNAFNIPNGGYKFTAGKATTLKWKPDTDGTVSLKLQSGDVLTPDGGSTIASNIDNSGSYTWTPPKDIANEPDYTIQIVSDDDHEETNYLPRFSVSGATATESSTASSASASSTTASSSSASTTTDAPTTTSSPSTLSTITHTTNTSTSASTTGVSSASSSSATGTSSSAASASSTDAASSTGAGSASATASDTSAGVVNRVSGGLLAVALGVVAMM